MLNLVIVPMLFLITSTAWLDLLVYLFSQQNNILVAIGLTIFTAIFLIIFANIILKPALGKLDIYRGLHTIGLDIQDFSVIL